MSIGQDIEKVKSISCFLLPITESKDFQKIYFTSINSDYFSFVNTNKAMFDAIFVDELFLINNCIEIWCSSNYSDLVRCFALHRFFELIKSEEDIEQTHMYLNNIRNVSNKKNIIYFALGKKFSEIHSV